MNKSYIYIILFSCLTLASGCSNIEEFEEQVQDTFMTFSARLENGPDTKTVLGTKDENGIRSLLWMPEDSIGIASNDRSTFDVFVNKSKDVSEVAVFEGRTVNSSVYYAFYPYGNVSMERTKISFVLSSEQTYKAGSFDKGAFPMIARAYDTDEGELKFLNLCGVLELKITGKEKISSIVFYSENKVSGPFTVQRTYSDYPEIVAGSSASTTLTLNCGEGVQLNQMEPTSFYLVLPPGEYQTFTLVFNTTEGAKMLKKATKPLTIKRSVVTAAGALEYVESVAIDLSMNGTSNSYIVPEQNEYRFNASVIGNGAVGIVPDAHVHTTDPNINPSSVEVLWETKGANVKAAKGELLYDVTLKDGYVLFASTGVEGNALVAVKDNEGTIIWSWHLWFTDTPAELKYTSSNGSYVVLDRNMGAIRADSGSNQTERKESWGAMYQWGRKDPFVHDNYGYHTFISQPKWTVAGSITEPANMCVAREQKAGLTWTSDPVDGLWKEDRKTIYDPCPVGYKIANKEVWYGFTTTNGKATENVSDFLVFGEFQEGWNFFYDGVNTTWVPAADYHDVFQNLIRSNSSCNLWNSSENSHLHTRNDAFFPNIGQDGTVAYPVRCMKDASMIPEVISVSDITSESATLTGKVAVYDNTVIEEMGFIVSTVETELFINNENCQKLISTGTIDQFTAEATGLVPNTIYYVRAYAVGGFHTKYGATSEFRTNSSGVSDDFTEDDYEWE